ncbi:MAG: NADH-quinone oxidoreductase subunit J [Candidatus Omnitrophica bacterium]|nr:NADH-quinone oxidoreductase subunit J [Candidatus Omnitrophota bacterium]
MIADIFFMGVALLTLLGALLAVSLKNVFYNALSLILSLFGVACLFIFLNSEFLAIIEIILYIGAIAIAIIFAIMLSSPMIQKKEEKPDVKKIARSFILAALFFWGLLQTLRRTVWPAANPEGDYSLGAIGKSLLSNQILPFETVSLVLLVAIIGALMLAEKKGTAR